MYERAHLCLDLVSGFLVLHMGLLRLAGEYGLLDYEEQYEVA